MMSKTAQPGTLRPSCASQALVDRHNFFTSLSSADRLNTHRLQVHSTSGCWFKSKSLIALQEGAERSHIFNQNQVSSKTSALRYAHPLTKLTGGATATQPGHTAEPKASTKRVKSQAGTRTAASEVLDADQEQTHREIS